MPVEGQIVGKVIADNALFFEHRRRYRPPALVPQPLHPAYALVKVDVLIGGRDPGLQAWHSLEPADHRPFPFPRIIGDRVFLLYVPRHLSWLKRLGKRRDEGITLIHGLQRFVVLGLDASA